MDVQRSLTVETVGQAQLEPAVHVAPKDSIRKAVAAMQSARTGNVLVCEDNRLLGIFTERDALKLMAGDADWEAAIETVMARAPVTIMTTEPLLAAIQRMVKGGYRRLPVVNQRLQPVGVITVAGVVHFLAEHFPQTIYNLPPHPDPVIQEREGA